MRKGIKILGMVFSATVLLLIILPLAGSLLLDIPAVQNFVVHKAAEIVSRRLETTVSIDRVDIGLFSKIRVQGFYVEDYQRDTLLYVGHLDAYVTRFGILGGGLTFSRGAISDARLYLRQTPSGEMNIKQLVDRISNPDRERKGNFRHGAEYCPRPAHRTDKPNRFDRKGKPSVESAFPEQSIDQRMQSEKDDERKKFIERGDPAERQTNERRRRKREKPADAEILCKRQHERDLREDITRRKYERHVHADDHKDRSQRARYRRKRDLKRPVFHCKACVLP